METTKEEPAAPPKAPAAPPKAPANDAPAPSSMPDKFGRFYSPDFKARVVAAYLEAVQNQTGESQTAIGTRFGVNQAQVSYWVKEAGAELTKDSRGMTKTARGERLKEAAAAYFKAIDAGEVTSAGATARQFGVRNASLIEIIKEERKRRAREERLARRAETNGDATKTLLSRPSAPSTTGADRQAILDSVQGLNAVAAAKKSGLSETTIKRWRREAGAGPKSAVSGRSYGHREGSDGRVYRSDDEKRAMLERVRGMSQAKAAETLGIAASLVHRWRGVFGYDDPVTDTNGPGGRKPSAQKPAIDRVIAKHMKPKNAKPAPAKANGGGVFGGVLEELRALKQAQAAAAQAQADATARMAQLKAELKELLEDV